MGPRSVLYFFFGNFNAKLGLITGDLPSDGTEELADALSDSSSTNAVWLYSYSSCYYWTFLTSFDRIFSWRLPAGPPLVLSDGRKVPRLAWFSSELLRSAPFPLISPVNLFDSVPLNLIVILLLTSAGSTSNSRFSPESSGERAVGTTGCCYLFFKILFFNFFFSSISEKIISSILSPNGSFLNSCRKSLKVNSRS